MKATYFTCTLGQAAALNLTDKSFQNINGFIASRARSAPQDPAVAFPIPASADKDSWDYSSWSFSDIENGSANLAKVLKQRYGGKLADSKTVALICPSTPEFLFMWLALMRLGHAVLLIAPQCQAAAIAHLCQACETTIIFHDDIYSTQAKQAADLASEEGLKLTSESLPFTEELSLASLLTERNKTTSEDFAQVSASDVAYFHHTSGTSSGVPKPIPQTHRAGAGVLPTIPGRADRATFTTTPLYHGGIADLLRAWSSGALIWLFPGKGVPITANNIIKCLDAGKQSSEKHHLPPIKYFSSVPYVLQMMESDARGLDYLRSMDIVGVGGAALPSEVGDRLVSEGVNLISRYGSAECGFLMSSHRDYQNDKQWQYLRSDEGADNLRFENYEDNLVELVVTHGWPHMAKKNRDDGSFATSDLFAPHKSIPNAWRYDSRADSQLTLITGKKFDPAPLEGSISTSEFVGESIIFGNGKPFPGLLVFRSEAARAMPDSEMEDKVWPIVQILNAKSQDHARIPQKMLVIMPVLEVPLEKSSKGTIIRGSAEARFSENIEDAITNLSSSNVGNDIADDELPNAIRNMIHAIVPKKEPLGDDTDLFAYGVDSVAGMQVRYGMRQLLPLSSQQLPLSVVEDCGTVARLAQYVIKQRHGQEMDDEEDEHRLMLQLVEQYSNFEPRPPRPLSNGVDGDANSTALHYDKEAELDKDVVVLTGATGALGAHILALYREMESVSKIICLVRGTDNETARRRVSEALEHRGLPVLPSDDAKVEVLVASLGECHLGLSDEQYERITAQVSIVMHVAWAVNFRMRLRSFVKDNISGVTNLINMALKSSRLSPAKFAYCSSIASVLAYNGKMPTIPEEIIDDPAVCTGLGYSRSKWVAEQICARAGEQTPLGGSIAVFRVGQLTGDSCRGVWNTNEAWPIMLSSVKLTRALPALEQEPLNWLPVDTAAVALTQGIAGVGGSGDSVDVLHVLNENRVPLWTDLLEWLKEQESFDSMAPAEWVARLEDAQENTTAGHPAFKLLGLWKMAYLDEQTLKSANGRDGPAAQATMKTPDLQKTKAVISVLRDVKPMSKEQFLKLWHWIDMHM
ncbi:hypothetical protein AAFC00_003815 [Neodothiora populina]|uniref:Carrier domain-containing protein n=1 Tax=Neodothiora populina TaxID=2781224 RepID=A0ABR3PFT6_9PEZI